MVYVQLVALSIFITCDVITHCYSSRNKSVYMSKLKLIKIDIAKLVGFFFGSYSNFNNHMSEAILHQHFVRNHLFGMPRNKLVVKNKTSKCLK